MGWRDVHVGLGVHDTMWSRSPRVTPATERSLLFGEALAGYRRRRRGTRSGRLHRPRRHGRGPRRREPAEHWARRRRRIGRTANEAFGGNPVGDRPLGVRGTGPHVHQNSIDGTAATRARLVGSVVDRPPPHAGAATRPRIRRPTPSSGSSNRCHRLRVRLTPIPPKMSSNAATSPTARHRRGETRRLRTTGAVDAR